MKKSITELLNDAALASGARIVPDRPKEEDIERMASAMMLIPELHIIMMGYFFGQTWKNTRYGQEIEEAKRKGTTPKVEIIVHGNEVMN
jgi:hypothetical protein